MPRRIETADNTDANRDNHGDGQKPDTQVRLKQSADGRSGLQHFHRNAAPIDTPTSPPRNPSKADSQRTMPTIRERFQPMASKMQIS